MQTAKEEIIRVILESKSYVECQKRILLLPWEEPVRIGRVMADTPYDMLWLMDVIHMSWDKVYTLVRVGGLDALSKTDSRKWDRFNELSTKFNIYVEDGADVNEAVQYILKPYMFDDVHVALRDIGRPLAAAWRLFCYVYSKENPDAELVFVSCGGFSHLINIDTCEFDLDWEFNMTIEERCCYLNELRADGNKFVPSGFEYTEMYTEQFL